jgi:hypothetical protein
MRLKVIRTGAMDVKVIPAIQVAPGLAVAKALEDKWVNGLRQVWQMRDDYWVYHIPSNRYVWAEYLTQDQALKLANVFASWTDIDWTLDGMTLGLNEDLKNRIRVEVEQCLPHLRRLQGSW